MTTAIASEVQRRRIRPAHHRRSAAEDLASACDAALLESTLIRFPSPRYRDDPAAFAREILGVEPWEKQLEILAAVRDHKRVAVSSGHKIGKSASAILVALWYWASYEDARVVMSSTTARQVDQILWRELRMMRSRGGRCVDCKRADPEGRTIPTPCPHSTIITEEPGELARTGLKSADFREIVGFTAREAEAVAGISGKHLLYIIDEASGVPREIYDAIEGNRAGGARIVLFSNPTRTEGEFFDAFHSKANLYHTITVSSADTPNAREGRIVIPGLATREWIEEKRIEWGEDSPLFKIRVEGKFATREDGKIFSTHTIEQAEQRWYETPDTGPLFVGLDPAGATGTGDETVFAVRRGMKLLELLPMRGLNEDAHVVHLLAILRKHRLPRERPVVVIDREGNIGSAVYGLLRAHVEDEETRTKAAPFELIGIRASDKAKRQPKVYGRMRDELAANLEAWFRDGGAILEDAKLAAELHVLEWYQNERGFLKVTPKDEIREKLERSPDRYDALALACWEPLSLMDDEIPPSARDLVRASRGATVHHEDEEDLSVALDPYEGTAWGRR